MSNRSKRIPAGELTAYERWELPSLGQNAKAKAPVPQKEEVKPLTAADLEQIRQQAYEEGFAQGKEEGHVAGQETGHKAGFAQGLEEGKEQGLREGQAHIKQTQQQLTRLMQCLSEPLSEEQQKVEETMLNVTLAIARSVIRRELQINSTVIQEVILEALALLPRNSMGVVFRVNPIDADYVRESLDAADSAAEVKVDESVQSGGCLVDTHTQQYDYTIEKRFQKLVHQMLLRAASEGQSRPAGSVPATMEERADFHVEVLHEAEAEQPAEVDSTAQHSEPESIQTRQEAAIDSVQDMQVDAKPDEAEDALKEPIDHHLAETGEQAATKSVDHSATSDASETQQEEDNGEGAVEDESDV